MAKVVPFGHLFCAWVQISLSLSFVECAPFASLHGDRKEGRKSLDLWPQCCQLSLHWGVSGSRLVLHGKIDEMILCSPPPSAVPFVLPCHRVHDKCLLKTNLRHSKKDWLDFRCNGGGCFCDPPFWAVFCCWMVVASIHAANVTVWMHANGMRQLVSPSTKTKFLVCLLLLRLHQFREPQTFQPEPGNANASVVGKRNAFLSCSFPDSKKENGQDNQQPDRCRKESPFLRL